MYDRHALDRLGRDVAEFLQHAFDMAVLALASEDRGKALAQVERLREATLDSLKNWEMDFYAMDHEVKVKAIALDFLERSFTVLRAALEHRRDIEGDEEP